MSLFGLCLDSIVFFALQRALCSNLEKQNNKYIINIHAGSNINKFIQK